MLKLLRLSFSLWLREFKRGQWTILLLSLALAVAAISSIQFISVRIENGLSEQNTILLGGNLVISSTTPIPPEWPIKAKHFHLKSANIVDMQTMVTRDENLVLVNLQAVSADYPLFGNRIFIPPKNALIDQRLLTSLNTIIPFNFKIGAIHFKAVSLLPSNLELNVSGWLIAPRVLIRLEDLAATQTLVPGSRANYRLLLAGESKDINEFRTYVEPLVTIHQRLIDTKNQRYSHLNNLNKVEEYIQLIILVTLFMCGVAIALSVRQYVKRHHKDIALWRCLGASAQQVLYIYLFELAMAALLSGIIGIAIGYFIHLKMIVFLSSYFPFTFPPPGWQPYVQGLMTSVVMLFCFAYPTIHSLSQVKPLALWHDDKISDGKKDILPLIALCTFILFSLWLLHFTLFSLFVIACIMLFIAVGMLSINGLFALLRMLVSHTTGVIRRGLSQVIQFPESSGIQIGAFSIVIMFIILLQFMKIHLLDTWQDALATKAPNYFAFNITKDDVPDLVKLLTENHLNASKFYPIIKGRLVSLNDQPILSTYRPGNNHNALHRDLNLSVSLAYPRDNQLVIGKKWNDSDIGKPLVSVESSLASALELKLGDELGFVIAGKEIRTKVSNIRTVNWASFNPNFYIIFPPGILIDAPATYIMSFYLPENKTGILSRMIDKIPNMTIVDMEDTLKKIQAWIQQATTAIQGLFIFSLLASLIIFIAALITTMDERRHTYYLIHLLGGNRRYIIKSILVEMSAIMLLTIIFAYSIASLMFYMLIHLIN